MQRDCALDTGKLYYQTFTSMKNYQNVFTLFKEQKMKLPFETEKLYYGFPIFILGYKDQCFGYNITTSSSSYSLGDMVVIGLSSSNNATEQIKYFKEFTLNVPTENQSFLMERAGFITHRDKLKMLDVNYNKADQIDAPLLADCPLSLECRVEAMQEFDNYVNFTARIVKRWVDRDLLDDEGHLNSRNFHPLYFMGDGKERLYRYLDKVESDELGSFSRKSRKLASRT